MPRIKIRNAALAEAAQQHVELMEEKYADKMRFSAENSVIYGGPDRTPVRRSGKKCEQVFRNLDSLSAAILYEGKGKIAVLNFADYVRPGGLYLSGGNAQEESLCMESDLFGILQSDELSGYYGYNKKNRNRELYTDRGIYTPGVFFARDGKEYVFDVITCAAPNKSSAGRYNHVTTEENHLVMQERIRFLRDLAEDQGVDVLIVGAWGCGAFGQPPTMVAKWMKVSFLDSGVGKVVYAVPSHGGENANVRAFRNEFGF